MVFSLPLRQENYTDFHLKQLRLYTEFKYKIFTNNNMMLCFLFIYSLYVKLENQIYNKYKTHIGGVICNNTLKLHGKFDEQTKHFKCSTV